MADNQEKMFALLKELAREVAYIKSVLDGIRPKIEMIEYNQKIREGETPETNSKRLTERGAGFVTIVHADSEQKYKEILNRAGITD